MGETPASLGLVVAVGCAALLPVAMFFAVFSRPLNSERCDGGIWGTAAPMPTGMPGGTLTVGMIAGEVGVTDD